MDSNGVLLWIAEQKVIMRKMKFHITLQTIVKMISEGIEWYRRIPSCYCNIPDIVACGDSM